MRNLLASMLFGLLALLGATQAQATCGSGGGTCYAIGVTGTVNWTSTSNWSASSGGASCTCVPATTDAVLSGRPF